MPILRKRTKGPIKGSYKKRKSSMCENCSLLVETWFYGKLHKNTEHEVGYYYNVAEERVVEKSGGLGIGASLSGPSVEASLGTSVVTTNGCPQILMFHFDDSDHCYSCFKESHPSVYRGALLSLEHTASIRDDSEDNDEEIIDEEEEQVDEEMLVNDEEPEICNEKYEQCEAIKDIRSWSDHNGYNQEIEEEDEKEPVEEEKEAAEEICCDEEEKEKELDIEESDEER